MADVAAQLKDALRDRYLLERELGLGRIATYTSPATGSTTGQPPLLSTPMPS